MKLRAKHGRRHYKSDESFLNAVYRNNKALIDNYLGDIGRRAGVTPLQQFKFNVYESRDVQKHKGRGSSIVRAMNVFTASSHFIPEDSFYRQHFMENLTKGLKRFGALKTLYKLTGKRFDPAMVTYIGDNMYSYHGYTIRFKNSPQAIEIYDGPAQNSNMVASIRKQSEWYEI